VVESSVYDILIGASSSDIRQRTSISVHGETIPPRDLSRQTRAESFDAYAGAKLVDETKPAGTAVEAANPGDWIAFRDADLRNARAFTAQAASVSPGSIEVRLDSPTGRLIGTAAVTPAGDVYRYVTTTAPLTRVSGHHDVYLVFSTPARLSTFSIR
jgi:beta-glucosidase